jgi:putative membrane protein
MRFLLRLVITAAALWVAVRFVPGISYTGSWLGLLGVAIVFGLLNAIVRPILFAMTCPLVMVTLGLFVFVLNGVMLLLTSYASLYLGLGFAVEGFVPAVIGSVVISVVSAVLNIFVGDDKRDSDDD